MKHRIILDEVESAFRAGNMKTFAEQINSNLFSKANFQGRFGLFTSRIMQRNTRLMNIDCDLRGKVIQNAAYQGLSIIPIDQIRGTFGKQTEFDWQFHPLCERSRERWLDIAAARLSGRELPPVDLVKLGGEYYVRDGHHRISVSRSLGQSFVDAEVTVIRTRRSKLSE